MPKDDAFELPSNCPTKTVKGKTYFRAAGQWVDEKGKPEPKPKK